MRVDPYTSQVGAVAPVMSGTNPAAVDPLEEAAGQLGRSLQHLTDVNRTLNARKESEDAHLWAMNKMSEFRQRQLTTFEDAKNAAPEGAEGFAGTMNSQYEAAMSDYIKQAPSKQAAQAFELQGRAFQNQFFAHSLQFEGAERQRFRFQQQVDGAKSESNEIDMAFDPTRAYMQLVPARLDIIKGVGEDPATRSKIEAAVTNHFSKTLVLAEARRDPVGTLAKIDNGTYAKMPGWNLYGDQLEALRRGVETRAKAIDAGLPEIMRDTLKQWEASYQDVRYDAATGQMTTNPKLPYTKEELTKHLGPVQAREWLERAEALPFVAEITSKLPAASPEEQQRYIAKFKEDKAAGRYSPALSNIIENELNKSLIAVQDERRKDPGLAASKAATTLFGEAYTTGSQFDRLALRKLVQVSQFGMPETQSRLMTDAELKAQVDSIRSMKPDQVQAYFDNLPNQFTQKEGQKSVLDRKQNAFDPKTLAADYMSELYGPGKLPKEYMWMSFAKNTHYGNDLVAAIDAKEGELEKGLDAGTLKNIKNKITTDPTLKAFNSAVLASAGSQAPAYAGSLYSLITKVALAKAHSPKGESPDMAIDGLIQAVIKDQVGVNGTYYVPKIDHLTGQKLDSDSVDKGLRQIGNTWKLADGTTFVPDIKTSKIKLQGSQYHSMMSNSPRDDSFVWLTNETGTGVFRAIQMRGSTKVDQPGVYAPVLNLSGQRYEILFKDVSDIANQATRQGTSVSVGKIR